MPAAPACLITGLTGTDKRSFLAALALARSADAAWALLDNDGGGSARDLAGRGIATAVINGCACCNGQVLLQTGLVQLLRRNRPQLLIVAVDGAAEPAALGRVLEQPGIAQGLRSVLQLCVAPPQWLDRLPPAARARLLGQIEAADGVIARDPAAAAKLRAAGAKQVLQADDAIRRILALASDSSASVSRIAS
jgi:G3E family GTPase